VAGVKTGRSTHRDTATPGTRDRLVDAGRHLFWEKGYAATGLAEVLSMAGANSGSFYHFFESKDALLRAVLELYLVSLDPVIIQPAWEATSDPIERLFALLDGYRERLQDTDCRYGCPLGRLAFEIDPDNTPAHELIARNFTGWKKAVEGCVRAAGLPQPADVAALVLTVMEGGVMQARSYRSLEPFDACVRQLRLHLTHLAATPRPRAVFARRSRRRS
jgi:TetR/AcrR family transcriptional regulator, transcriptional repressor for nem operon